MSIKSQAELLKLQAIGRIVRLTLDAMAAAVRPGMRTAELDRPGAGVLAEHGAESSPAKVPGTACISVNDEVIHGIPGERALAERDLVKFDVTAEKAGFVAEAAVTVNVGSIAACATALARCAESAFQQALLAAHCGNRVRDIGRVVENEGRHRGFSLIRESCGHDVGRTIHEEPCIPNHFDPAMRTKLTEGLVITIGPIVSARSGRVRLQPDKWTYRTSDGGLSAHYEHTTAITRGAPILLTVA